MPPVVQAGAELPVVQAELVRVRLERLDVQRLLRGEQPVVELPELALVVRAVARLGRLERVGMIGQRKVLVDESDLVRIAVDQRGQRGGRPPAVRTFEVGELDDHHRRVGRSPRSVGRLQLDLLARRVEHDRHVAGHLPQLIRVLEQRQRRTLLLQYLSDFRPHLLERPAAETVLVPLVDPLDLVLGHLAGARRELLGQQLLAAEAADLCLAVDELVADDGVQHAQPLLIEVLQRL